MPSLSCPSCRAPIAPADVNVASNVAFCRACNVAHALSTLAGVDALASGLDPEVDLANPPQGAWYRDDGVELVVGASMRSIAGAIGALFICLFWNGIVSVFVLIAIAGSLHHMGVPLPAWFPAPNMSGSGSVIPLGMVLFLWVFLTPFILIGLTLLAGVLTMLGGRTEIVVRDATGTVSTGIGAIGWRRRFDATSVKRVTLQNKRWRDSDGDPQSKNEIVIEADKTIRFGSTLREERRKFLASALHKALVG